MDRGRFREQTAFDFDVLTGGRIGGLVAEGLLADDGRGVWLTRRGVCVADALVTKLVWG